MGPKAPNMRVSLNNSTSNFFSGNCFGLPHNNTKYKPWFVPGGKTTKRPAVLNSHQNSGNLEITVIRVEDIENISPAVPMKDSSSSRLTKKNNLNLNFLFLNIYVLLIYLIQ